MSQSKTYRKLQFENEYVRVWKTVISPSQPLEMHKHSAGRVLIGLKGGKIQRVEDDGTLTDMDLETHKAYWQTADPHSGGMHGDVNLGDEPVEIMVVEMKHPKDRPLPSMPID